MLDQRLKAAYAVRDAFLSAKRGAADLANKTGACVGIMVEQREKAGLAKPGFGARPIAMVSRAAALIAEAEDLLAAAHPVLGEMIVEAGLSRHYEYATGPDDTPEPRVPAMGAVRLAA